MALGGSSLLSTEPRLESIRFRVAACTQLSPGNMVLFCWPEQIELTAPQIIRIAAEGPYRGFALGPCATREALETSLGMKFTTRRQTPKLYFAFRIRPAVAVMSGLRMLMYIPLAEKDIPAAWRSSPQELDTLLRRIQGNPAAEVRRFVSLCLV